MFKWSEKFGPNLVWDKFWTVAYLYKLISIFSSGQKKRNQFQKFSDCAVQFFKPVFVKLLAYFFVNKFDTKPKHGSSDDRAGDWRYKGPGFNPLLDTMRLCFKIYVFYSPFELFCKCKLYNLST